LLSYPKTTFVLVTAVRRGTKKSTVHSCVKVGETKWSN
jgi:hypothetical protein